MNNETLINMICEAYIEVMGAEKWNSLTVAEQHDVIMNIASEMLIEMS
jgi:hypothetical protein